MDDDVKIQYYLEMWKQTIGVQQHFNDIEWRIRGLALTVITFALGAAAVAAKEKTTIEFDGWTLHLSTVVLVLGLLLWWTFYFVDQVWYHRLLVGAVKHGEALEKVLRDYLPEAGLTMQVSESSSYHVGLGWGKYRFALKRPLRSRGKLCLFYAIGSIALVLPAVVLQIAL